MSKAKTTKHSRSSSSSKSDKSSSFSKKSIKTALSSISLSLFLTSSLRKNKSKSRESLSASRSNLSSFQKSIFLTVDQSDKSPVPSMDSQGSENHSWMESPIILPTVSESPSIHIHHSTNRNNGRGKISFSDDDTQKHKRNITVTSSVNTLNSSSSELDSFSSSSSFIKKLNDSLNQCDQNTSVQSSSSNNTPPPTPPPFVPITQLLQYQKSLSFDLNTHVEFASEWKERDFHEKFPEIPADERFIGEFHSASREDVLIQGKLYISQHHLCFRSTVLPHKPFVISIQDIIDIQLKTTMRVPNSISIETESTYYFFTNFIKRTEAWALMNVLWDYHIDRKSKFRLANRCRHAAEKVCSKCITGVEGIRHTAADRSLSIDVKRRSRKSPSLSFSSFSSSQRSRSPQKSSVTFPRPKSPSSFSEYKKNSSSESLLTNLKRSKSLKDVKQSSPLLSSNSPIAESPQPTSIREEEMNFENCDCGKYHKNREIIVDHTFPCSLNDSFRYMFTVDKDNFHKNFFYEVRQVKNVKASKWSKDVIGVMSKYSLDDLDITIGDLDQDLNTVNEGDTRVIEYIMPLNNPLARQTKCIVEQRILSIKPGRFFCIESRTTTPDVPSGDAFASVNRYCVWKIAPDQTKILASFAVEWSKSSWFKSQIEKSSSAGNKKTYELFLDAFETFLDQKKTNEKISTSLVPANDNFPLENGLGIQTINSSSQNHRIISNANDSSAPKSNLGTPSDSPTMKRQAKQCDSLVEPSMKHNMNTLTAFSTEYPWVAALILLVISLLIMNLYFLYSISIYLNHLVLVSHSSS